MMPVDPNRVQVTLYLPPELNVSLKEIARIRDKKVSHLAVALLQEAVRRETKLAGTAYLMPEINAMLEDKLSNMEKQFIRLLTRTAIESGATKRLVIRLFIALRITTADEINAMENEAWNEARNSLRKPLESLDQLIASLRSGEVE
jgi:hypothetical protein